MTYRAPLIFLNGDSFRAEGSDALLMQKLANQRDLMAEEIALLTPEALACIQDWCEQGWLSCFE
jgi:50S ribosomal protein L16 3-hydroxylase